MIYRCLVSLMALLTGGPCAAQFSVFEHPNIAPMQISGLLRMLEAIPNVVYNSADRNAADQRWDARRNHYTGNLLTYFRYPEMAAAGYRSFSVVTVERHSRIIGSTPEDVSAAVQSAAYAAARDKRRVRQHWYYSDDGWLQAVRTESLYPESEAYIVKTDSFFYRFLPDSAAELTWMYREEQHSAGYAGNSKCGPLPPFHHIYKQNRSIIRLDRWHNMTSMESTGSEQWDTCDAGGPRTWKRQLLYDEIGRLTAVYDSSSDEGLSYRVLQDYGEQAWPGYLESRKGDSAYAQFRHPIVAAWMKSNDAVTLQTVYRTTLGYRHHDGKLRTDVNRPDSPSVARDTAYFVTNASRERVIAWKDAYTRYSVPSEFAFYDRAGTLLRIQYTGLPETSGVGASLPLAAQHLFTTDTLNVPEGRALRFRETEIAKPAEPVLVGERERRAQSPLFTKDLPATAGGQIKTMVLFNGRGLAQYLWSNALIYQLTYAR